MTIENILKKIKNNELTPEDGLLQIKRLKQKMELEKKSQEERPQKGEINKVHLENVRSFERDKNVPIYSQEYPFQDTDIAVIGMSGRFPGADDVDAFWKNIKNAVNSVSEVGAERWDMKTYYDEDKTAHGKAYSKYAGLMNEVDCFDPLFFHISPMEAEIMDPQQRIFLEEAWKCLEDAGCSDRDLDGKKCGVFVGATLGGYEKLVKESDAFGTAESFVGSSSAILAGRIAYFLNITGPCITLDTACSSSLVAIHYACESLARGECEMALAGGVSVMATEDIQIQTSKMGILSPTGVCRSFDEGADGTVMSEGAAVVALKPAKQAVLANDHIYGIIKGTGINQDGKTNGITAPNAYAQAELEYEVYKKSGIHAEDITMVEGHATGTLLGDPIEIKGLTEAFRKYTNRTQYCSIGSAKANIGHTTMAAGVSGLIKVLLSMKYKKIPPLANFKSCNRKIPLTESPFYISQSLQDWEVAEGKKRIAAVSSFGFSGTNAHLVVEEYEEPEIPANDVTECFIAISAKTEQALERKCLELCKWLETHKDCRLDDISFTLLVGRSHFIYRRGFFAVGIEDCIAQLKQKVEWDVVKQNKMKENALYQLAERFMDGEEIDFNAWFQGKQVRRISMPVYPFEKEHYWIRTKRKEKAPFPTEVLWKKENQARLKITLEKDAFYLSDHVVMGNHVLPGVAHLELARIACEKAFGINAEIEGNLVWVKPIHVEEAFYDVEVELTQKEKCIEFVVRSLGDDALLFSQGEVYLNKVEKAFRKDVDAIKKLLPERLEKKECYRRFAERNLVLGTGFQTIQYLYHNETESLAYLEIPEKLRNDFEQYQFHPAFMDGILEAVVGLSDKDPVNKKFLELPFSINQITKYNSIPCQCYSYAREVYVSKETGMKRYDVTMLDLFGNVIVDIKGFTSRPILGSLKAEKKEVRSVEMNGETYEKVYLNWDWEKKELSNRDMGNTEEVLLFFGIQDHGIYDIVHTSYVQQSNLGKVVIVTQGEFFKELEDGSYEICPDCKEDYQKLFASLNEKNLLPDWIIHNWSEKNQTLHEGIKNGVHSLFFISQVWMQEKIRKQVVIYYTFDGQKNCPIAERSAVASFLRVVSAESMRIKGYSIMFEEGINAKDKWACIQKEQRQRDKNDIHNIEICYENPNNRFVMVPKCVEIPDKKQEQSSIKKNRVVLITGGMGGLGIWFAKYFATEYQASIVLSGRSPLTEKRKQRLKELRELGAEAIYVQADVTEEESVQNLIQKTKEVYHRIDGVIHCAGVLHDAFIIRKQWDEFREVLAPKIYGVRNLDLATKEEALDFFVMCSSGSALLGIAGQGDYSYANSFQDHYAKTREYNRRQNKRSGKTISINWPLWSDGGMGMEDINVARKIEESLRIKFGLISINQKQGMESLESAFLQPHSRIMPTFCKRRQFFKSIGLEEEKKEIEGNPPHYKRLEQNDTIEEYILEEIKSVAAEVLRMKKENIRDDAMLTDYGFNSMVFTEYTNLLNTKYGLSLAPAVFFEYTTLEKVAHYLVEEYTLAFQKCLNQQMPNEVDSMMSVTAQPIRHTGREKKERLLKDLKCVIREVLPVKEEYIDEGVEMSAYGLTSSTLMEFADKVNRLLPVTVNPAIFYEYTTLVSFVDFLLEEYKTELQGDYESEVKEFEQYSQCENPEIEEKNSMDVTKEIGVHKKQHASLDFEPMAIVGMHAIMPESDSLEEFWDALLAGKNFIRKIPENRWNWRDYYGDVKEENKTNVIYGSFLKEVEEFDADFFGIPKQEADFMDPQQRLILQTVWKTIEDAGYSVSGQDTRHTGVFIGTAGVDYLDAMVREQVPVEGETTTGVSHCILANRISYLLNLTGPSEPVDTACSSALVAIHRAIASIKSGECNMAIAGGVNIISSPLCHLSFAKKGMLSEDGKCKTFDREADGYVRGEGVGAVLLKPLSKAKEDGDHIYAVIKGSAVNHGGHVSTLTAPNPVAQAEVIEAAMKSAQISPDTITYVETHGTGTSLGDQIEVYALKKAFHDMEEQNGTSGKKGYCALGAVKSNIGHLEAAAGFASLVKVLMAMKYHVIPANANLKEENSYLGLKDSQFYLVNETKNWDALTDERGRQIPRRAGISSFGFGGVNAHIIVEEYVEERELSKEKESDKEVIVLSAKTKDSLHTYAQIISEFLKNTSAEKETSTRNWNRNELLEELKDLLAHILMVEREEIDSECQLASLGLDQYGYLRLSEEISRKYGKELSLGEVSDRITLGELAALIVPAVDVQKDNGTIRLQDLAFTLQCGREEMKERISFVAESITDVWNHLDQFVEGRADTSIYAGTVSMQSKQNVVGIQSDNYEQIAKMWANGERIDWILCRKHSGKRITLPTYPFAKTKYWYPKKLIKTVPDKVARSEPVAIIGMSGVFPKAKNIDQLWENLIQGRDAVTEIPNDRWDVASYYSPNINEKSKTNIKYGAFLDDIEEFDEEFFQIMPKESKYLDPQQKIMLQVTWRAMEHAGYQKEELSGRKIGVFIGAQDSDYQARFTDDDLDNPYLVAGNCLNMVSNRISYFFNLNGASEVINTACSSSAVAIHRAVKAIQHGECEMSFAGGISIMISPKGYVSTAKLGVLSEDGVLRAFDKKANGYVKGEGAGMLLLKPLSKAKEDGDHIYAVILGSAENHGGKASVITAPNTKAQTDVISCAQQDAGIQANTISYIEAHGTGTVLGDPVEIEALKKAFMMQGDEEKQKEKTCGIGSVKSHIGHLEQAAGVTGVIKTIMSMQKKILPGMIHLEELNPYIQLEESPFYIVADTKEWDVLVDKEGKEIPRRAGVSSFGIGGSNVHIILEEYTGNNNGSGEALEIKSKKTRNSLTPYPFKKIKNWLPWNTKDKGKLESKETLFYKEIWKESDFVADSQAAGQKVIFCSSDSIDDWERVQNPEQKSVYVCAGNTFQKLGKYVYQIRAEEIQDYEQLFKEWKKETIQPKDVIYAWAFREDNDAEVDLSDCLSRGYYDVFYFVQALLHAKWNRKVKILYVYPTNEKFTCAYSAVTGFFATLAQEQPDIQGHVVGVDMEKHAREEIIRLSFKEISAYFQHVEEIKHVDGKRYVRKQERWKPEGFVQINSIREGGTYLITGGTGNIGQILARTIAKERNVNLYLTGRSVQGDSIQELLDELNAMGTKAYYIQSEMKKLEDIQNIVSIIKEREVSIQGVFHCAGNFNNGFILKKSAKEMEKVLAPKVYGTVYWDEVLKDERLDFFLLFSSVSALKGKAGQCDYSYANRFLDCFAEWRCKKEKEGLRYGKTFSVNWPFWEEGGMHSSNEEEDALARQYGLYSIPTKEAVQALNTIMMGINGQCSVLYGEVDKIRLSMDEGAPHKMSLLEEDYRNEDSKNLCSSELKEKTSSLLKEILVEETGFSEAQITGQTGFDQLGINSIVVNRFNGTMDELFGELSKTLLYEYNCIDDLANYLVKYKRKDLEMYFGCEEQAIAVVETKQETIMTRRAERNSDIAIIGVSGKFPESDTLEEYWQNLKSGKDCISTIPEERWDVAKYYDTDSDHPKEGKMYVKEGGFIKDIDLFDPLFFNIAPSEASRLDPQERLFLEKAWEVMEDGGYAEPLNNKRNRNIGVFVASTTNSYQLWAPQEWQKGNYIFPDASPWSIANRVSYVLNLNGPSMPVDTACSSGITAIHLACESLKKGECTMAIAGGVNLYLHPYKYVTMSQAKMLSPTGKCHTFGAQADGFIPGEGIGAVLLKPLEMAERDGDYIYGVIKGSAINHGGRTSGYTVPNPNAQADVVRAALREADIAPETITYVEAHGTGTALGDPIEITGLNKVFGGLQDKKYCAIGSVKPNIGHLESAAGIAGLIKVLLQMKHKQIVPSIHSSELNPNIDFQHSVFYVPQELQEWNNQIEKKDGRENIIPLRAGISSFGAGGANGHMIVEEYISQGRKQKSQSKNLNKKRYWISITEDKIELQKEEESFEKLFYETKWKKKSLDVEDLQSEETKKNVIVIYSKENVLWKDKLSVYHKLDNIYQIEIGAEYLERSKRDYVIREASFEDMENVLQNLEKPDKVYFLTHTDNMNEEEEEYIVKCRNRGIITAFHLLKLLSPSYEEHEKLELKILTECAQKVLELEYPEPYYAGLIGFIRSVVKEYKWLHTCCVDFGKNQDTMKLLVQEPATSTGSLIAYRDGERYEKELVPLNLSEYEDIPELKQAVFAKEGVYVIIGGLGSIGFDLACYLSENFHAKLVLAGRSAMDKEKEEKLEVIRSKGGEVKYVAADLTNEESLEHLMKEAKETFKRITGVVHSAMVFQDKSVGEMSEEQLVEALAPKEFGLMKLSKVLKYEQIKQLILFSSGQTFATSARRSSYAASCYFEDAYGLKLANKADYEVKIVNWGYWGSAKGKQLEEVSKEYEQSLLDQGILPMSSSYGMKALTMMLRSDRTQIYTFHVKDYVLKLMGVNLNSKEEKTVQGCHISNSMISQFTKEQIWTSMEQILEVERSEIPEEQAFMDMGVDSILGGRLMENLNQSLGIEAKVSDLFEYYTISLLTSYLAHTFANEIEQKLEGSSYIGAKEFDERQLFEKLYQKEMTAEEVYKILEGDRSWCRRVD